MAYIMLSNAIRNNLLALNGTQKMMNRTQERLATKREVNSAVDDAVRFFQSKGLMDRSEDLVARQKQMEQGVKTLDTVTEALEAMEAAVKTIKGVISQVRNAGPSERAEYTKTLIRNIIDINNFTGDATYQGLNLLNSTSSQLRIQFSDKTTSDMKVQGVNFTSTGTLYRDSAGAIVPKGNVPNPGKNGETVLAYLGFMNPKITAAPSKMLAPPGPGPAASTFGSNWAGPIASKAAGVTPVQGLSVYRVSIDADNAELIKYADLAVTRLDATLSALKAQASTIGNFVAILKVRINFTETYTNTLEDGGSILVAADMTREGANSLALTTSHQLGIQALNFAGQAEQSILQLFR